MRKIILLKCILTLLMLLGFVFPATPIAMADGPDTTDPAAPVEVAPADAAPAEAAPADAPAEAAPADVAPADAPVEVAPADVVPADAPVEAAPADVAPADAPVEVAPAEEAAPADAPVADIIAQAAAADVVLADAQGVPLIAAEEQTAQLIEEGDPWFIAGGKKYGFTFNVWWASCVSGCDGGCIKSDNPIQTAINYAKNTLLLPDVTINIENPPLLKSYDKDVEISSKVTLQKSGSGTLTIGGKVTLLAGSDVTNYNIFANNVFVNGGSIQDGVDLVKTGGTVTLADNVDYGETVTIDKNVNLRNTGSGATTDKFILNSGARGSASNVFAPEVEVKNGASLQLGVDLAEDDGNVSVQAGDYQNVTFNRAVNISGLGGDAFADKFTLNTNDIDHHDIFAHEVVVNDIGGLQLGVDLAEDGGYVRVVSGYFTGNVDISKNIHLSSQSSHTTYADSFTLLYGASGSASSVFAPNVFVNSGASLQLGIDLAQAGGNVTVGPGTYNESLEINKSLYLMAPSGGAIIDQSGTNNAVITLGSSGGLFDWGEDNADVFIDGFTLLGGTYGIKVEYDFEGSLTVQNTIITRPLPVVGASHDDDPPVDTAGIALKGWDLWLFGGGADLSSLNLQNVNIQGFDNGIDMNNDHVNVDQLTILDSVIANNTYNGLNLAQGKVNGLDVENTNFYDNGENGIYIGAGVLGSSEYPCSGETCVQGGGGNPYTLFHNRFFGNGLNGVLIEGSETPDGGVCWWWPPEDGGNPTVSAMDNWWGCNAGPGQPGCDTAVGNVDTSTWLVYGMFANPQTILTGGDTSKISGPYMYSSGDPTHTQVTGLPWLPAPGPISRDQPHLGTLLAGIFTSGATAGTQWFSAPAFDNVTPSTFVDILHGGGPGEPGEPHGGGALGFLLTGGAIPVTGAGLMDMLCGSATSFVMDNGDMVTFTPDLCGYQASLGFQGDDGLPAALPAGSTLVDGLVANLVKDGNAVDGMPAGTQMTFYFVNPPAGAVVLFWDVANNTWVEVPATVDANGMLVITSTTPGVYVVVTQ